MAEAGHQTSPGATVDAQLAALASKYDFVVGLDQTRWVGLSDAAVRARARNGRLHRVHRGVYSLVPAARLTVRGRRRAALLACGSTAALSHADAAEVHGLRFGHRAAVELVVPGRTTHRLPGITVHRSLTLEPGDTTIVDGLPVTSVARTLLDLAATVAPRALERALDRAEVLRVFDLKALRDQLTRNPRHCGRGALERALEAGLAGSTLTWSELEEAFLSMCRAARLPAPVMQRAVDPGDGGNLVRPDFSWPVARLAVETDGSRFHLTRRAFEEDRLRDQRLAGAGWRVIRVTGLQLTDGPDRIAVLITRLLAAT